MDIGIVVDDVLEHYGKRGMKWGHRSSSGSRPSPMAKTGRISTLIKRKSTEPGKAVPHKVVIPHPTSSDAKKFAEHKGRANAGGTKTLSTKQLQEVVNRMNLEQNYKRMTSSDKTKVQKGAKVASGLLAGLGKQGVGMLGGAIMAKQVAKIMAKTVVKAAV